MPRPPFTPAQTRDWQARMQIRLPDKKDLRLARLMKLESEAPRQGADYDKTVAGYVGELKRGEARAITWFLENPARLSALARVCGCRPEDFQADLAAVEASDRGPLDLLWWSGFEDLGPVTLEEGFVLPPVRSSAGARLDEEALRKLITDQADIRVSGAPGAGVHTLLRWLTTQAEAMGWRAVCWDGALPAGRSVALLADPDDGLEEEARRAGLPLADWLKTGDRRLLRRGAGGLRIDPVDLPWLRVYRARVAAKAGRKLRLGAIADAALAPLVGLGPEEAGIRLRERLQPSRGGPAGVLVAAAQRRLAAQGRPGDGLAHLERWLPTLYLQLLRAPQADVTSLLDETVVREAAERVEALPLSSADRALLRSALPWMSGEAARLALRGARLLDERAGQSRLRLAGLLAPLAADKIRDDPGLLRRCLTRRDQPALSVVFDCPGGPEAIVAALESLAAPGLQRALGEIPPRWRGELPWTPSLVARWLALVELDGRGGVMRDALERLAEVGADALPGASAMVAAIEASLRAGATSPLDGLRAPLPDLALCAAAWAAVAGELGLDAAPPDSQDLQWIRALHLASLEDLRTGEVWRQTPDVLLTPSDWLGAVRMDAAVARAACARVGDRPDSRARALWVEGAASLCERAPEEGHALLRRRLDGARQAFAAALDGMLPEDATTQHGEGVRWTSHDRLEAAWSRLHDDLEMLPAVLDRLTRPDRLRPLLADAASDWRAIAQREVGGFSAKAFAPARSGLYELLRALPEAERVAWLRAPSGAPGPFAPALARVGVPAEALIALFRDLDAAAAWPAPAPGDLPGDEPVEPRAAWLQLLSEGLPPERICELQVDEADWSGLEARSALRAAWYRDGEGARSRRRWLWTRHRDLSPADPVWGLVEGLPYKGAPLKLIEAGAAKRDAEAGERGHPEESAPTSLFGLAGAVLGEAIFGIYTSPEAQRMMAVDGEPLSRRLRAGGGGVAIPLHRWAALARAALMAGVEDEALWGLLALPLEDSPGTPAPELKPAAIFAALARRLVALDRGRLHGWLSAQVAAHGALLDQPELVDRWAELFPSAAIRALLDTQPGEAVGAGLAHALLRRAPDEIGPLLENPRTRTATLQALSRDPGLRPELTASLARLEAAPAAPALQAILGLEDPDPVALLREASQGWTVAARVALWRQVARVAAPVKRKRKDYFRPADRRIRARAWEELAELEGVGRAQPTSGSVARSSQSRHQ